MPRKIPQSAKDDKKLHAQKLREESEVNTPVQHLKSRIFFFLERPQTRVAISYHIFNLLIIIGSIVLSVISTIDHYEKSPSFIQIIFVYELLVLIWFSIEYFLRVLTCNALRRYDSWKGKLIFIRSFYMCVDLFVIVATVVSTLLQLKTSYFTVLRVTRFLQVFRILRLDRQKGDLGMMYRVVYTHRKELITCYFVGFIILFGGAYIVYILEKKDPKSDIDNMANGLYWAIITVTSVGYGDMSPSTIPGKMVTGIFALVGCAFFALPSGILGSGFALQVAKQKNKKKFLKIKNPAAIVIQTVWRNYAVQKSKVHLMGTWDCLIPQLTGSVKWPGYYVMLPGVRAVCNAKNFDAFDIESEERHHPTVNKHKRNKKMFGKRGKKSSGDESDGTSSDQELFISACPTVPKGYTRKEINVDRYPRYKAAIRFVLRVKYWTCLRCFKKQRYPYVNLQEIMEKNAQSHIETISYLKLMRNQMTDLQQELDLVKSQIGLRDEDITTSTLEPTHTPEYKCIFKPYDKSSDEDSQLSTVQDEDEHDDCTGEGSAEC